MAYGKNVIKAIDRILGYLDKCNTVRNCVGIGEGVAGNVLHLVGSTPGLVPYHAGPSMAPVAQESWHSLLERLNRDGSKPVACGAGISTDKEKNRMNNEIRERVLGMVSEARGTAKEAEAIMAQRELTIDVQEAYAEGFCKAAEVMGVDPVALCKQALPAWLGQLGARIAGAGRAIGNSRAGQAVAGGAKRYWGALTGSTYKQLRGAAERAADLSRSAGRDLDHVNWKLFQFKNMPEAARPRDFLTQLKNLTSHVGGFRDRHLELLARANEAANAASAARRGMVAARVGTGVAGAGGAVGLGALALGGDSEKGDSEKKAAYAEGFRKAAEDVGVDPDVLMKSAGLFKALGKMGLLTLAGYGGIRGYQDYKAMTAPPPPAPPPAPPPSILDRIKGFASEHPVGTAAAAIGIPLLAYGAYKALKPKEEPRAYYPYG